MRRTRFITLMFLALAVAFFCVEDFRWALEAPLLELSDWRWLERLGALPPEELRAWAREAETAGEPYTLAFVALHLPRDNREEIVALAEKAVALKSRLTWIYYPVAKRFEDSWKEPAVAARMEKWMAAVEAYDPQNAVPLLWRAELVRVRTADWPRIGLTAPGSPYLEALAAQKQWQALMARAVRQPLYDSYGGAHFDLVRQVLRWRDRATPSVVLYSLAVIPLPNLLNTREYAAFEVNYLGARAAQAGRRDKALSHYYDVAAFGRRMHFGSKTLIEQLIAQGVERIAAEPLLAALKQARREPEAALVELRRKELDQAQAAFRGLDPVALTSSHYWSALLVHLGAGLVVLFGLLTLFCVGYVNLKQWVRREKRGPLYQVMTMAENYVPILLFLSCLALYVVYTPYAYNFRYYLEATATGKVQNFEPLFYHVFPSWTALPRNVFLPIEAPFVNYLTWGVAALVVAVIVASVQEWYWQRQAGP